MQQNCSIHFACRPRSPSPPPEPGVGVMGSKGQNSSFSEHDHVAYQIKGNHKMRHHGSKYFARRPPPTPRPKGMGSKGQVNFLEHGHNPYLIKVNNNCKTW